MKTKGEFRAELERRRRERVSEHSSPAMYVSDCVELMFDLAAETLADLAKAADDKRKS